MKKLNNNELGFDRVRNMVADYATTPEAKDKLQTMHLRTSVNSVNLLLNETAEMLKVLRTGQHVPFVSSDSLKPLLQKVDKGLILNAVELEKVADLIRVNRLLKRFLIKQTDSPILNSYATEIIILDRLENDIYHQIEHGEVSNEADRDLARFRIQVNKINEDIKTSLQHFLQGKKYQNALQERMIVERDGHYTLPVKASYRDVFSGQTVDVSNHGSTVYIEPNKVANLVDQKIQLESQISAIEMQILGMLSAEIFEKLTEIKQNMQIITDLDVILARAKYALAIGAVRPSLNIQNKLILVEMKHPLLDNPVPLSVEIGNPQRGLIITGPNAGGKTVTLKTIALSILMTELGLFLPAQKCDIPVCDHVYSLIGDQQDIDNSLSTFSGEMVKISQVLKQAQKYSLIVLDELGSGTDPDEGSALAIATLQELQLRGCIVVATTHYSTIKDFSVKNPAFMTASMDFDLEKLTPTYRLIMNRAGESRALWIAERSGMPQKVLQSATQILTTGELPLRKSKVIFKEPNKKEHTKTIFHKGDIVFVGDLNKEAIFYSDAQVANKIVVFVDKEFREVLSNELNCEEKRRIYIQLDII